MANFGTWLFTKLKGEFVGEDANGNRYYQARSKKTRPLYHRRRWVIYKGEENPLTIAPEWYPWLQYLVDEPLAPLNRPWLKTAPAANETGTASAWFPDGDPRALGQRPAATGDYTPWTP
ncbi:NADH:ubiquinone oxidoreductase subunit NDUFA12 [Phaeovibrio sulfidiphilus]|uniref:NADH:ubiquinone oxidoreductase subunit NDUFA12 n=1 Tax=Phaeovibrio sulfidiphilus TaxID=1220600 RepID=A0A8J6YLY8_9PROT|nr:NADH-ubiquinone oxidoreductase subunit NDUFA12 family protein [Phaeovibrio sulfidiphilus]MBE1237180.1 NADH:ubiquinone oxidoreductase subunit NDUFA12 [Phaeovibrio sulfidiphilus]